MTDRVRLTLTNDQLQRLLDGLESLAEPLPLQVVDHGKEPLADWQDHHALMNRLQVALTRTQQ